MALVFLRSLRQLTQILEIRLTDGTVNHAGVELDIIPLGWWQLPTQILGQIGAADATQLASSPDFAQRVTTLISLFQQGCQSVPQSCGITHSSLHLCRALRRQGFIEVGQKIGIRKGHAFSVASPTPIGIIHTRTQLIGTFLGEGAASGLAVTRST